MVARIRSSPLHPFRLPRGEPEPGGTRAHQTVPEPTGINRDSKVNERT